MKFVNANMKYFEAAVDIAFETYSNECKYVKGIGSCNRNDISVELTELFQKQSGILCLEDEKLVGYLVYSQKWDNNGTLYCIFPFWGYGAVGKSRVKIMSMVFQALAEQLCTVPKVHFEIKVYAHDYEIIQLFSLMQFGIQCEEGLCYDNQDISCKKVADIRELTNDQISKNWNEIWQLLQSLIEHLRNSPIFYPGVEFTENVYQDYLLDDNTRIFVSEIEGSLVGVITANIEGNSFVTCQTDCCNVGDVYVVPNYRGSMVAQNMLKYLFDVLSNEGIRRFWVEHGTANPNARGFWNKFFDTYAYTMIRDIEME